jgi:hypothetical protein
MITNILLGLILLVLVFIAFMLYVAGERYFATDKK